MSKRTQIVAMGILIIIFLVGCGGCDFDSYSSASPQGNGNSSDCPGPGTMLTVTRSNGAELWVTSDPDDSRIYGVAPWNAGLTATGKCVPERSGVLPMIGTEEGWVFRTDVNW